MGLTNSRVCKLQNSSNPMFDANFALAPNIRLNRFLDQSILVELTGIEPVASWLQTRRSPS
jgi:hypothetical protein